MTNRIVIYHGNCDDGFGAAYSAWKFFGDSAQYIPGEYGLTKEFPFDKIDVTGKEVFILDFSYDKESMIELEKRASYVRLIDHHKSAFDILGDMSCCEFDMSHSGAYLAWKNFHPKKPVPKFIELIQDRDLWTKKYEETEFFTMGLRMFPMDFKSWEKYEDENSPEFKSLISTGKILRENMDFQIQGIIEKCSKSITIGGIEGTITNCPSAFVSDMGSVLSRKTNSFAILWSENKDGKISCSLRSTDDFNCIPFIEKIGGGGHPQACATKFVSYEKFQEGLKALENEYIPGFGFEVKKKLKP